jgi:hypothetical protein
MNYSGSDWLIKQMSYVKPEMVISELGLQVADLLGELFYGIYHLDYKALNRVDWANTHYIEVSVGWKSWSSVDFDTLTRLVFLAHHRAMRIDIAPIKYQWMRLLFHQRGRTGSENLEKHPTLDEAVSRFKQDVYLPEF